MAVTGTLDVVKMHGAENAFLVIDDRPRATDPMRYVALAREWCAPDGGFDGADGLLVVGEAPGFAASMRVINADGSEAEMCGNGVRCVARYLAERGAGDTFAIETLAGPIGVEILSRVPAFSIRVDIGPVSFPNALRPETLAAPDGVRTFYEVSLGNPHAVIFCDDPAAVDLAALGNAFARDARFPLGTNVHVVRVAADAPGNAGTNALDVRHFERGVGLTQACGTGAVACAATAIALHGLRSPVQVRVPGGTLVVDWTPGETARLTGGAEITFARAIEI